MGARPTCLTFSYRSGGTRHNWPSNFFIEEDGTNVEAEFQYMKLLLYNPWVAAAVKRMPPGKAKKYGRKFRLDSESLRHWESVKIDVMKLLVGNKLADWEWMRRELMLTGDAQITEVNWWHDNEWGDCSCMKCYHTGENKLGEVFEWWRERLAR